MRWVRLFLMLGLLGCSATDDIVLEYPFEDASDLINEDEAYFIFLLNEKRAVDLNHDVQAYNKMQEHCKYLIDNNEVSHFGYPDRLAFFSSQGALSVEEIISFGQHNVEKALIAFNNSPKHEPILNNAKYDICGICIKERYYVILLIEI